MSPAKLCCIGNKVLQDIWLWGHANRVSVRNKLAGPATFCIERNRSPGIVRHFPGIGRCAAVQAADFLGKKRVIKASWGLSAGKRNMNYHETEGHKIKPHKLRNLRDHECVLGHCEQGFRRGTLPPLEPDGSIAKWFARSRRAF
jgi:hypothetical protein